MPAADRRRPGADADAAGGHHLAFLGHGAERTGPPILLGHLLHGLAAEGRADRTSVVAARGGPLLDAYRAAGADARAAATGREPLEPVAAALRRAGGGRLVAPAQAWARGRAVRHLAGADLVYVNAATPPTAALLRALDLSVATPVVLHVHELDVGLRLTLDPADLAFLLARADHVIAASAPVAELLAEGHGVAGDRLTRCDEFIDVAAVAPLPRRTARQHLDLPADAHVVGSVGLPDWRKDPERLLHATWLLRRDHPDLDPWVVWIGGEPDSVDGRHLADEARRLGLTDRFRHVSHADRPDRLLGALDLFALPAREDAFPLAALEAAAAGLAVVCFRAGGVAGLADQGAGLAVEHPDVAAFAGALAELLADPDRRARLGRRAAELVRARHDVPVGSARIRVVLDEVLARSGSRRSR